MKVLVRPCSLMAGRAYGGARVKPARYKIVVVFDTEADGMVIASAPGIPGGHVYGRTRAEALRRQRSALRFYIRLWSIETFFEAGRTPPSVALSEPHPALEGRKGGPGL